MKNLIISNENLEKEEEIFLEVKNCIDSNINFVFDAGAGSGKTYSLIQTLKYILSKYSSKLKTHNQLIRCITYTNIAAKEIKERLGNTELVKVSTIHDFLWEEIKSYQDELVDIHKKYITEQIVKVENELKTEKWADFYKNISNKSAFNELVYEKEELYYKNKNKNATDFRSEMSCFADYLNNVNNFKQVIDNILKIRKFNQTIENITKQIKNDKIDYTKVSYNSQISYDRLDSMQFSHDTLIGYSKQLINNYKTLQKIISDKYPYILVDEYQDTSSEVIKILSKLSQYAQNELLIGYYGDKRQSIYDTGVANNLLEYHKDLRIIKKEYNRRSAQKIITIGNLIRNDNLKQKTIYNNCPNGQVNFYIGKDIDIGKFINFFYSKWSINQENPLDCLFLKNEEIACRADFKEIYNFFKNTPFYKGRNFSLLREHILSKEPEKLGKTQTFLYYLLDFKSKLNNPDTLIQELINKNVLKELNIKELKDLVLVLKNIKGNTLKDYCSSFFNILSSENNNIKKVLISFLKEESINTEENLRIYLLDELFLKYSNDANFSKIIEQIENFLNLDMQYFNNWYNYISSKSSSEINYHTYHSTKGDEFNNVVIIIENDFGKINKNFFGNLIRNLSNPVENEDKKIRYARNLFYVAVTRAKENLAILYTDELDENQKNQIKNVFGDINIFE